MKISKSTQRLMIECGMKYIARHGGMAIFWTSCTLLSVILLTGVLCAQAEGHAQNELKMLLIGFCTIYSVLRTSKYIYEK